ncbi:hypothetical protein ACJA25_01165 [Mycoplasmopsis hyopharyngis]|uniref:hypothetical protein n=1 Tax=Mycoplasmopsis hyopharyngis TaxID=29558 RepID=UPI003872CB65
MKKELKMKKTTKLIIPTSLALAFIPVVSSNCIGINKEEKERDTKFLKQYNSILESISKEFETLDFNIDITINKKEKIYKYFVNHYENLKNIENSLKKNNFFEQIENVAKYEKSSLTFYAIKQGKKEKITDSNTIEKINEFLNSFETYYPSSSVFIDKELRRLFDLNIEIYRIIFDYIQQFSTDKSTLFEIRKLIDYKKYNQIWKEKNNNALEPSFLNIKKKQERDQTRNNFLSDVLETIPKFFNGKNNKSDEFSYKFWNESIKNIDYNKLFDENSNTHVHAWFNLLNEWKTILTHENNSKFDKIKNFVIQFNELFISNEIIIENNTNQQIVLDVNKFFNKFKEAFQDLLGLDFQKLNQLKEQIKNDCQLQINDFLKVIISIKEKVIELQTLIKDVYGL